jgi:hypothetical protein
MVVRVWDTVAGRERLRLEGHPKLVNDLAFFPDGVTLASVDGDFDAVRVWDLKAGRLCRTIATGRRFGRLAVSPDGKTLATVYGEPIPAGAVIRLWEIATGQSRGKIKTSERGFFGLAFTPDGRKLLAAGDENIHLLSLDRQEQPQELLNGHRGPVLELTFSPDGRFLASAGCDAAALVWDWTRRVHRDIERPPPDNAFFGSAWASLESRDAEEAYRAAWGLANNGRRSVSFLQERLRPASPFDSRGLAQLIADLGDDSFELREKAYRALEAMDERSLPGLRAVLDARPPVGVKRYLEQLLGRWREEVPSEKIRVLRAVEVLERIGTPQARDLLQSLACGATDARLTREAKEALERLERRNAAKP